MQLQYEDGMAYQSVPERQRRSAISKEFKGTFKRQLRQRSELLFERIGPSTFRNRHRSGRIYIDTHVDLGSRLGPVEFGYQVTVDGLEATYPFSILAWLGIMSQTYWQKVEEKSIDSTIEFVFKSVLQFQTDFATVCSRFIAV